MFNLFKKDTPSVGSVLYRGNLHPRPEEYSFLERSGIKIRPGKAGAEAHWSLHLEHADWGTADLIALKDAPAPPRTMIEYSFSLTPAEKAEASAGGHIVTLHAPAARKNVLRDRKNFLRFARAVMADDGLVVIDHVTQILWSRAMLDDELVHDADLDIEGVYCLHAVTPDEDPERVQWLHTHGLAELGAFDFDILNPADELFAGAIDGIRALAFAVVEGELQRSTPRFTLARPGGDIRMVPVEEFNKKAPPGQRMLRDAGDTVHNPPGPPRAVVCDPVGLVGGLLGAQVRMSRFLSRPLQENSVFAFSNAASDLMAERARATIGVFQRLRQEFADLDLPALVKLGIVVDGGGPSDKEHLWFQVHGVTRTEIDGTLVNQPFGVSRLKAGQRTTQPLELLSDWTVLTPAGPINARSMRAARFVREHRLQIAEAIRAARETGP